MADDWFDIDNIKITLKKAAKNPMPFAFGVGAKLAEGQMAMHPKRKPEFLGRALKKEGFKASRILVGTAETDGANLIVTCEEEVPNAKKSLKYFLKANQLRQKKVQLFGPNGEFDVGDDDDEDAQDTGVAAAAPGSPDEDTTASERLAALKTTSKELAGQIGAIADPATRAKMAEALKKIIGIIQGGDANTAGPALEKLQKMVARFAGEPTPDSTTTREPDKWAPIAAKLEPQVMAALEANHPEAGKIRAVWAFAQEKAEAGDITTALKAVKRLAPLLKAAAAPGQDAPPADVVAFQRSRVLWIDAKRSMKSDLEKFRAAVARQSADDGDQSDIMAAVDDLVNEFNAFDTRLEDVLDEITQTSEGAARSKLKKDADKAIEAYLATLETPFFKIIDDNPFVAVNVAGRGKQSLSDVKATLASGG